MECEVRYFVEMRGRRGELAAAREDGGVRRRGVLLGALAEQVRAAAGPTELSLEEMQFKNKTICLTWVTRQVWVAANEVVKRE